MAFQKASDKPEILVDFNIERKIFGNSGDGFYVAATDLGTLVVKSALVQAIGPVTALGNWEQDPRRGLQFQASRLFFKSADAALKVIIQSGFLHGIKEKKAQALIDTLGDQLIEVLDAAANWENVTFNGVKMPGVSALRLVDGIGPIVAQEVIDSWKERRGGIEYAVLAAQAGLNLRQYKSAMTFGGTNFKDWILNFPYRLSSLPNFDWKTVDAIAKISWPGKEAIPHNSPQRLAAAVREVIEQYSLQGHMAMPFELALNYAKALAKPTIDIWEVIKDSVEEEGIVAFTQDKKNFITQKKTFDLENESAKKLVLLMGAETEIPRFPQINISEFTELDLSEEQADAVRMVLDNNISIVTGGPGVGKTVVTRVMLDILDKFKVSYTLCAPTGKAARRMKEATGRSAATLHREFHIGTEDVKSLGTKYLFLDEVSMVSSSMFHQVLDLVGPGQRIVFIGDPDQLPPVGAGEPLMQMLFSGLVPTTKLNIIHRFAGGIARAAHDINVGIMPESSKTGDFYIEQITQSSLRQAVTFNVDFFLNKGFSMDEIAVLTTVNKGPLGRHEMNKFMQDKYNPSGVPIQSTFIRTGDKVIQTKNTYEMGVAGIMNGQTGIVLSAGKVDDDIFSFEENSLMTVDFEGEVVHVDGEEAQTIDVAYSLTVHKTQGSQYPVVICILPITREDHMLRQLAYTAITRASKHCVVLSDGPALKRYVENTTRLRRISILSGLMAVHQNQFEEMLSEEEE